MYCFIYLSLWEFPKNYANVKKEINAVFRSKVYKIKFIYAHLKNIDVLYPLK